MFFQQRRLRAPPSFLSAAYILRHAAKIKIFPQSHLKIRHSTNPGVAPDPNNSPSTGWIGFYQYILSKVPTDLNRSVMKNRQAV